MLSDGYLTDGPKREVQHIDEWVICLTTVKTFDGVYLLNDLRWHQSQYTAIA